MAKPGAYISDVNLLEKLNDRIVESSEAMANIDANVGNYINSVNDTLERQLDSIKAKLQDAEQRLSEAESSLSVCHASQIVDPETGTITPSCEWEESAVESARIEVEKWRTRYEQGQQVFREFQHEIGEYNGPGGGHNLILTMCAQQTPQASRILRGCIDNLQEILNLDMVARVNTSIDVAPQGAGTPLSDEGRVNDIKDFFNLE